MQGKTTDPPDLLRIISLGKRKNSVKAEKMRTGDKVPFPSRLSGALPAGATVLF
jgi:hypothetical protein